MNILLFLKGVEWIVDKYAKELSSTIWLKIPFNGYSNRIRYLVSNIGKFTKSQKPNKGFRIYKIGSIDRIEVNSLFSAWESKNGVLLVGEQGTGKTGIAWDIVNKLQNSSPVLYVNCKQFLKNSDPKQFLENRLTNNKDFLTEIEQLGKENQVYIVFDQLEATIEKSISENILDFINQLSKINGIRVLGIIRSFEWENEPEFKKLEYLKEISFELPKDKSSEYLEKLGIINPSKILIKLGRNLLLLSLLGEIISTGKSVYDIQNEIELWEKYIEYIKTNEGIDTLDHAFSIARNSINNPNHFLKEKWIDRKNQKLLSCNILSINNLWQISFRHEIIQEVFCAYALLPQTPSIKEILDEFGVVVSRKIIKWLLLIYHHRAPEEELKFITDGLEQEVPFYIKAEILDFVVSIEQPNEKTTSLINEFLLTDSGDYQRHFFSKLENAYWAHLLQNHNFFINSISHPVEALDNPRSFYMPPWYAGNYLKKVAPECPNVVVSVALDLITENPHPIRLILESILQIPPHEAAKTVKKCSQWFETPFIKNWGITKELGLLMEHLGKGGEKEAALKLLEILTNPIPKPHYFDKQRVVAGFQHDYYWLNHTFDENLPYIVDNFPKEILEVLIKQLTKSIDLEYNPQIKREEMPSHSYWRLNIRPDIDNNRREDIKCLLVDSIIKILEKARKQKQAWVPKKLKEFLESKYAILVRISIYILRTSDNQYIELTNYAFARFHSDKKFWWHTEFERFVDAQYKNLNKDSQDAIIESIYSGPKKDYQERIEKGIELKPDDFEGNTFNEKKQWRINKWKLEQFHRFAAYLTGETLEKYQELAKLYNEPDPPFEEGVITSWTGPTSPISNEELSNKTIKEVVNYLVSYIPPEDNFGDKHSREGLGRLLSEDVTNRVKEYAENANLFLNDSLYYCFHYHLLSGIATCADEQVIQNIGKILDVCDFILDKQTDKPGRIEFETGLDAAKQSVGKLIEKLMKNNEPWINEKNLSRIKNLILCLLNQPDNYLDNEYEFSNNSGDEFELLSDIDPITRSINSVHGQAMHSLFLYSLYCVRKSVSEKGEDTKPFLEKSIKQILLEKLNKNKTPSITVHAVFGWYFSKLLYLDHDWTIQNIRQIFPKEKEKTLYWIAAWSAYIVFSDVYMNVFPELHEQYIRSIQHIQLFEQKKWINQLNNRFAYHIIKAYMVDLIQFDSKDGILNLYLNKASDKTRSNGIFWLSTAIGAQKLDKEDESWQKIWVLWQKRLESADRNIDLIEYKDEISSFCRLLKFVPLDLTEIFETLSRTVKYCHEGFDTNLAIRYLSEQCDQYPDLAISLLYEIVTKGIPYVLTTNTENEIKNIFYNAKSGNQDAKEKAIELIDFFGSKGNPDEWRTYLDDLK